MRRHDRPSDKQMLEAEKQEKLVRLLDRAGLKMEKLGERARRTETTVEQVGRILDAQPVPHKGRVMYDQETDAMTLSHD